MQKNKIVFGLTIVTTLCLAAGLSSCKKDKKEQSPMLGLWNVQYIGTDGNENGNLDEAEKQIVPDTAKFVFQFKEGGMGETVLTPSISSGVSTTVPFTWILNNTGDTVTITAAGAISVVAITALNAQVFSGHWGSGKDRTWIYAIK